MARDTRGSEREQPAGADGYLGSADLDEILAALDLSPASLRHWLSELQAFCEKHGGARYYGDLMALVSACQDRVSPGRDREGR